MLPSCHGDLTFGDAELKEVKCLRILGVTLVSKLMFETHFREVASKAARNLEVVCRAQKLIDRPRVLKGYFSAYVLSSREYCAPCRCRRRSLICVRSIVLFAVRKGCAV